MTAEWNAFETEGLKRPSHPCLNCQVLDFTLDLASSVLKESDIDRGLKDISRQLTGIFGTLITS